jgi:predicted dehydrogenase/NADPH:quinone reductase-like Zn-dependent oxidoreductase
VGERGGVVNAKKLLNARADAWLKAAGHSKPMADEAKREAAAWVRTRVGAARRRRGLAGGWGVVWTNAGHGTVQLRPIEVPRAGPGEVTIEVLASAVSPGTERAYYLRLPNARPRIPHRPGYSVAGRVIAVGRGVTGLSPGDAVAAIGVPHASVATVDAADVVPVPDGVPLESAATVMLGVISGQGVALASIDAGDPVVVVGAGAIGLLAQRIAAGRGSGPVTVVAASTRREPVALSGGAAGFLTADDPRVGELAAPVVIEATGDPGALPVCLAAAAPGGRVVLLGSPRGVSDDFPVDVLRSKGLTLIGAHVNTLGRGAERRAMAASYLDLLAGGSVPVDDLVARRIDPREAERFYRELASDPGLLGALYDWALIPAHERVRTTRIARPPDVTGRGADPTRRLMPPARGSRRGVSLTPDTDPFAGAAGMLRVGIVGCGDIAVNNASAVGAAPNASVTACFDPDRSLAEAIASGHDAFVAGSYEGLLARDDVDAVFLSVPHHLHAPLARDAAAAGKHLVVEKPPANDLAGALDMARAAEEAGVRLSVCFPQRYQPDVVAARRLIQNGALGDISGASVELLMDRSPAYRLGGFSGRSMSDWRNSRERAGGGVLIMNLSHYVDMLHHLAGVEVEEVSAFTASRDPNAEIEDTITISARLSNGALASVIGSTEARGSQFTQVRLWGSAGQLAVDHDPRFYTLRTVDDLRTTRWQRFGRLPAVDTRALFVSRFATAVATGVPPDVTVRESLAVQAFMEAAYRSSESGQPVRPADLLAEVPA